MKKSPRDLLKFGLKPHFMKKRPILINIFLFSINLTTIDWLKFHFSSIVSWIQFFTLGYQCDVIWTSVRYSTILITANSTKLALIPIGYKKEPLHTKIGSLGSVHACFFSLFSSLFTLQIWELFPNCPKVRQFANRKIKLRHACWRAGYMWYVGLHKKKRRHGCWRAVHMRYVDLHKVHVDLLLLQKLEFA